MFFLSVKTILFMLRVFKFIMTMFFSLLYHIFIMYESYPPRTVKPTRILYVKHMILEH
ncbi:hypothetical protein HanRHA438_Chr13g0595791 [Helianthus annuus]|nr:hypothetical protein HanRHA438_Chr13g0595791 [Helianthus annuus]